MINLFSLKFKSSEYENAYLQKKHSSYSLALKILIIIQCFIVLSLLIYNIYFQIMTEIRIIRTIIYLSIFSLAFFILIKFKKISCYVAFILNITSTVLLGELVILFINQQKNGIQNDDINISSLFFLFYSYGILQSLFINSPCFLISLISIIFNIFYYTFYFNTNNFFKYLINYIGISLMIILMTYKTEKSNRLNFLSDYQTFQIYEHYKYVLIKLSSNIKLLLQRHINIINNNSNDIDLLTQDYEIKQINDFARNSYGLKDSKSIKDFFTQLEIDDKTILKENYDKLKLNEIKIETLTLLNTINDYTEFLLKNTLMISQEKPILLAIEAHHINNSSHKFTIFYSFYKWKNEDHILISITDFNLEQKIKNLMEMDKCKDQVLASVVHDLRTPLNGMLFLMNEAKTMKTEEMQKTIESAEIQGIYLTNLINDILDYTRIKNDNLILNIKQFDLKSAIDEVFILFEDKAKMNGISLILEYPNQKIILFNDKIRLKQVLINFIGNSLKFTMKGFIKLAVKYEFPYVQFDIIDTGIGIEQKQLEKLFLPFSTFNSFGLNSNGIGLGLSISKNIIEKISGDCKILVESTIGKGTKFSFKVCLNLNNFNTDRSIILDCAEFSKNNLEFENKLESTSYDFNVKTLDSISTNISCKKNIENDNSNPFNKNKNLNEWKNSIIQVINKIFVKKNKKIKILIADDNYFNILPLEKYIENLNYNYIEIDSALNGQIALEKFENNNKFDSNYKNNYDLIIMDCEMPILNGFEASNIINNLIKQKKYIKCPIFGYSALNNETEIKKCLDSGMIELIEKPCTVNRFYELLLKRLSEII